MAASAEIMEIFSSVQGEGLFLGERQLFIRFYGCNRSCVYCDTEASRGVTGNCLVERSPGHGDFQERTNPVGAEEFIGIVRDIVGYRNLHHSLALTGGEPLLHAGFLAEVLPVVIQHIPVMLETNGLLHDALHRVLPWVGMISMDVKIASSTGEATDWESHRLFLEAASGKDLYVKAVITPQVTDEEIRFLRDLILQTDVSIPLVLQPVHGIEGGPAWTRRLLDIQAFCREQLRIVRIIPQIHKMLDML